MVKKNMNDEIENMRKRLIFRSEHRGTKEMDLLLGTFAKKHVPGFSANELAEYQNLLEESDPDLYNWISGQEEARGDVQALSIYTRIITHKYVA